MTLLPTAIPRSRHLQAALTERLGSLGLELHPAKTKIVCVPRAQEREVVV